VRNSLQEHQRQHHHHRHAHRQGLHVATIELGAMAEVSGHVKVEAQIQPPTDAAQAFILLHELAHLTGAPDFTQNDGGDDDAEQWNNMLVNGNCGNVVFEAAGMDTSWFQSGVRRGVGI